MTSTQPIGRKNDKGKPLAGTVLAGFWRTAGRGEFDAALCHEHCAFAADDKGMIRYVLDAFFDVRLAVNDRIALAATRLTERVDPSIYLTGAVEVGSYGALKYERDNWLHVDDGINRYYEAVGRHVLDLICGHWYDDDKEGPDGETIPGSGLPNLSHIFWGILAAAELAEREREAGSK